MKNLIEWLTPQILFDVYDEYIAKSRSKPWLTRADGLNRVDYEAMMQRGYGEELLADLRQGNLTWNPNLLTKIEKDDGSLRDIEIPAHDVHLISAALLERYQTKTRLPDNFFCRRKIDFDDEVGVQKAVEKARKVSFGNPVLKLDIIDFFGSLTHESIKSALEGRWAPEDIELGLELVTLPTINKNGDKISNPRRDQGEGICQGNPLSPLLAQFTISDVPSTLESLVEAQIWYVDDLLIVPTDTSLTDEVMEILRSELDPKGLALQPHKVEDALYLLDETFKFLKKGIRTNTNRHPSESRLKRQDRTETTSGEGEIVPQCPQPEPGPPQGQGEGHRTRGTKTSKLPPSNPRTTRTGTGGSPHRENDLNHCDIRKGVKAYKNHHIANPVNGRSRSPCVERDTSTDLDQGSGIMGYQSPSLRELDVVVEWIDRSVELTSKIRRVDKKILLEIDGGLGASRDKFSRVYKGSTVGRFPELPDPDDHADILLVDFGFRQEMRWKWRRREKVVRSTIGTVFNSWCSSGGTVHSRFNLDDLVGLAAAEKVSNGKFDRLSKWDLELPQGETTHLMAWHKSVAPEELRRLKDSPWIAVRRLRDGTHHVEDHEGTKYISIEDELMDGLKSRSRAAMYSIVGDAVEAAKRRGEEELVLLHCGDFQPGFFLDGWKARAAYLAKPVRRLKKLLSTFRRVDFVPICKNSSRGLWAMARTFSTGNGELRLLTV